MDVRSSETESALRRTATYAASSGAIAAVVATPVVLVPAYGRVLGTLVVLVFAGLASRAALGTALAFRPLAALGPGDASLPSATAADPRDADLPTVSVVVAAYDEADTLPATVEACRRLDYPDDRLEVLLCYEAASTDGTARVAEAATAGDPRFRVCRRDAEPGGKAAMANFGLERATGDVVAFVDAGQRPEPDALRRAVGWFRADDDAWCVKGRCWGTNADGSLVALHATVERHFAERGEFVAREVASGFTLFTGGLAVFRRTAFETLGPFDESVLLEDVEFASRIHAGGRGVRVDPGIVSAETNPESLASWWSRRKRWARGGMQVARRYVGTLPRNPNLSRVARVDAALTFGSLLALPLLVLALPAVALGHADGGAATFIPGEQALVALAGVVALASPPLVLLRDRLDGRPHSLREYAAVVTLPLYFAVEAGAVVTAFLDEFVLRRPTVYVPSDRPGSAAGGRSDGGRREE
ncbi:glycosyltransferase [Halomicrococcus sp. SG-WS-1]|uniref:glycosyltransferase n=1 Tax=Halomicrococcus sp. SG-WS-1 TaxID=3439057 RepID=UPI003F7A336E